MTVIGKSAFGAMLVLALTSAATVAQAVTVSGTFNISVYQGSGSGHITDPQEQAQQGNPLIAPATLIGSGTYVGGLNFNASQDTIGSFFSSGGGTLTGTLTGLSSTALSDPTFGLTTVFVITGNTGGNTTGGIITHDDGMSLYDGVNFSHLVAGAAPPTVSEQTSYAGLNGDWQLIYVEANGIPAILDFDQSTSSETPPSTPLPATVWLLGSVLAGGAGFGKWRRRRAVAA